MSFTVNPGMALLVGAVDLLAALVAGGIVGLALRHQRWLQRWWVELLLVFALFLGLANALGVLGAAAFGGFADLRRLDPGSAAFLLGSILAMAAANVGTLLAVGLGGTLRSGGRPPARWLAAAPALALGLFVVSLGWGSLLEAVGVPAEPQAVLLALERGPSWLRVGIMFFVVAWAPVVEELVFRGWLQPRLAARFGPTVAIGLQAAGFALMHLDRLWALPPLFVIGATAGVLRQRSDSVLPGMVLHLLNNGAALAAALTLGAR